MEPSHALGFRDLDREFGETALGVEGDLPDWLEGTLLRNGPGRFRIDENRSLNHWFDGLALLRRFKLVGETNYVSFAARFLRSEEYETVTEDGRLLRGQFGTDPYADLFERVQLLLNPKLTDNAVIGFDYVGDSIEAVTETPRRVRVNTRTLDSDPTRNCTAGIDVTGLLAHVHHDHETGDVFTLGTHLGWTCEYVLLRRDESSQRFEVFGRLEREQPAYLHSFGLTDSYLVFLESPFRLEPLNLLGDRPYKDAFRWTDTDSRIHVFDRESGEHRIAASTDPVFAFHHVNAYERRAASGASGENKTGGPSGEIVVDLVGYDDAAIVEELTLSNLRNPTATYSTGKLERYVVPLPTDEIGRENHSDAAWQNAPVDPAVTVEQLHAGPVEFPTINYGAVNTCPYKYVYAAGNGERPARSLPDRLFKIDIETGATDVWAEDNCYPGEPVFVPRHPPKFLTGGTLETGKTAGGSSSGEENGSRMTSGSEPPRPSVREDEGVVIAVVLDTDHPAPVDESGGRSFLLVLDGETFTELARAPLPCVLPFGFHGEFLRSGGPLVRSMA